MKCPIHPREHAYVAQYIDGWNSQSDDVCPWPMASLGPRCAWLAGQRDRHGSAAK